MFGEDAGKGSLSKSGVARSGIVARIVRVGVTIHVVGDVVGCLGFLEGHVCKAGTSIAQWS